MTATAFLQSNPELIDSLAELLSSKFDISPDLLKTVTQKAIATSTRKTNILVEKSLKEKLKDIGSSFGGILNNVTKTFKDSGLIGLGKQFKNYIKTAFTPAKEKTVPEFPTTTFPKEKIVPVTSTSSITEEKQTPDLPSLIPSNIQSLEAGKSGSEADREITDEKIKPIPVLLAGITPEGEVNLKEKLPGIFEDIFKKLPKQEQQKQDFQQRFSEKGLLGILPKGLLAMGGGLALLLGGIAALVTGLQSDGPFKGLLKIFSNVGITGGLKLLEKGAKAFINTLKNFIDAPIKLLSSVGNGLKGALSSLIPAGIKNVVKSTASIFSRMLGGLVKFLAPILKKVPLIGTIISFGFAYSRFKSGDVVGGIIDVLSGLVGLLSLTGVGAAVAIPIQIGLDVLNAFLDFKAGGSDKKASAKKTNILWDWVKGLGSLIYKGIKSLPIIGPAIKAIEEFTAGNYLKGIKQLAYIATPLEFIGALLGDKEASGLTKTVASAFRGIGSVIKSLGGWLIKTIWKIFTNLPIIGPLLRGFEELFAGNFGKAFKQFIYINPIFELIGSLLGDTEVGGVTGAVAGGIKGISGVIKEISSWLFKQVKKLPIIGQLIKTGEFLMKREWGKAIVAFSRVIPYVGWIMDLLGFTEDKQLAAVEKGLDPIKDLWKWIKDSLWEKVTGFIGSLVDGVKNWWNNLSWDPRSWIGMGPKTPEPLAISQPTTSTSPSTTTPEPPIPMAEGGIVTSPTNALIGEAGPEAVLPLDKMFKGIFDGKNSDLNNKTLESIANNTSDTNSALTNLSNAIYKLAQTFAKQQNNGNNIIINGQQQSDNFPSASQVASSNVDPIRQIRSQFAI